MKAISREELLAKMEGGGVLVVNVLAKSAYDNIRIRGSVSIPRSELENGRWGELDRSKEVVVYCSSYDCSASGMAAEFLEGKGFVVEAYEGGMKEWAESGLPTEGTVTPRQFLEERYGKPSALAGSQSQQAFKA